MQIDPRNQSKLENYKLMIGSIIPRPIAFVTSQNADGVVNAAPFSFFNVVSTEPPLVSISCMRKPNGVMKDTAINITTNKEFVIHVVDSENVDKINYTSADFPSEISEVEEAGLTLVPSSRIRVPGIKEAKIRMECKLYQWLPVGGTTEQPNADLIIGEIVCFDILDSIYSNGRIDQHDLDPVSRLAGTTYAKLGDNFSLPRPTYEEIKKQKELKD